MFRHYRVTQRDQGGYVIDVENPVSEQIFELKFAFLKPFHLIEIRKANIFSPVGTVLGYNLFNNGFIIVCSTFLLSSSLFYL